MNGFPFIKADFNGHTIDLVLRLPPMKGIVQSIEDGSRIHTATSLEILWDFWHNYTDWRSWLWVSLGFFGPTIQNLGFQLTFLGPPLQNEWFPYIEPFFFWELPSFQ